MQKPYNNIKEKLDGLDALPSNVQFDATKAWQKMEQELQQPKQKKKRFVWLSWAAVLLVVFSVGLLWNSNHHEEIAVKPILKGNPLETRIQQEKSIIVFENSVVKKERYETVDDKYKEEKKLIQLQPVTTNEIIIPIVDTITSVNNDVIVRDTVAIVTAEPQIKAKPKLRIVHMNEMYTPEIPTVADNKESSFKRTRVSNEYNDATEKENRLFKNLWLVKPSAHTSN